MIVVNGRFLDEPGRGVYRFASEITTHLLQLRDDVKVVAPSGASERSPNFPAGALTEVGRQHGHIWEQVALPRYLHGHGSPLLINLANRAPLWYSPQISTIHDIIPIRYPSVFPRTYRIMFRIFLRSTARHRRLLTVSEFSRHEISSFLNIPTSTITVIPNAPDTHSFLHEKAGAPQELDPRLQSLPQHFILGFSAMSANKNGATLIAAHSLYTATQPDALPLVLVGRRSQELDQTMRAHERPDLVKTLEGIDDRTLGELYRRATVFVFPSLYEGFGIPPLEAQSFGTPVIAADIPVMREVLEDSAELVDMHTPAALAAQLTSLLKDQSKRSALASTGPSNARRYSWNQSAQRLSALIDELHLNSHA